MGFKKPQKSALVVDVMVDVAADAVTLQNVATLNFF